MSGLHQHRCANWQSCQNYYDCTDPNCSNEPETPGLCLSCYQESFSTKPKGVLVGRTFRLGNVYATPAVLDALHAAGDDLLAYLVRHVAGDWGEVNAEDWQANEESLRLGERLLSVYSTSDGLTKFWIITERDRSATTALLPSDY